MRAAESGQQMNRASLEAVVREQQRLAAASTNGRSAATVYGGSDRALRQTVIAMNAGVALAEHQNPGEATVLVLAGRIELLAGDASWEGRTGDLLAVPESRHSLHAVENSAVLLTVARR
ncbi:MAG: cupin domain-containing protein [Trebonia sp.]